LTLREYNKLVELLERLTSCADMVGKNWRDVMLIRRLYQGLGEPYVSQLSTFESEAYDFTTAIDRLVLTLATALGQEELSD